MEAQMKRFWIVTAANMLIGFLSVPLLSQIMLAVAGFAAVSRSWTLPILPLVGVALSIFGLKLAKGVQTDLSRQIRVGVHAVALVLYCVMLLGFAAMGHAHK
jgi:hypothetical protein